MPTDAREVQEQRLDVHDSREGHAPGGEHVVQSRNRPRCVRDVVPSATQLANAVRDAPRQRQGRCLGVRRQRPALKAPVLLCCRIERAR